MVRSALGQACDTAESWGMAMIDLDLTDEHGMLCENFAEKHPDGTRALLAALNLQIPGAAAEADVLWAANAVEMAVFEATGCLELASIFAKAA
jgi:hypothetical protein